MKKYRPMEVPYFLDPDIRHEPKDNDTHIIQCRLNHESFYPIYATDSNVDMYIQELKEYGFELKEEYLSDGMTFHRFDRVDKDSWSMNKNTAPCKSFSKQIDMQRKANIVKARNGATYYVSVEKSDDNGRTLGGIYHGSVTGKEEIKDVISDSLDKCGSNLFGSDEFTLSEYGSLKEYIDEIFLRDESGEMPLDEETINFSINVSIKIGKRS